MSDSISRRADQRYDSQHGVNPSTEGGEAQFQEQFASAEEEFDPEQESRGKEGKQQDEEEPLPEDEAYLNTPKK